MALSSSVLASMSWSDYLCVCLFVHCLLLFELSLNINFYETSLGTVAIFIKVPNKFPLFHINKTTKVKFLFSPDFQRIQT